MCIFKHGCYAYTFPKFIKLYKIIEKQTVKIQHRINWSVNLKLVQNNQIYFILFVKCILHAIRQYGQEIWKPGLRIFKAQVCHSEVRDSCGLFNDIISIKTQPQCLVLINKNNFLSLRTDDMMQILRQFAIEFCLMINCSLKCIILNIQKQGSFHTFCFIIKLLKSHVKLGSKLRTQKCRCTTAMLF